MRKLSSCTWTGLTTFVFVVPSISSMPVIFTVTPVEIQSLFLSSLKYSVKITSDETRPAQTYVPKVVGKLLPSQSIWLRAICSNCTWKCRNIHFTPNWDHSLCFSSPVCPYFFTLHSCAVCYCWRVSRSVSESNAWYILVIYYFFKVINIIISVILCCSNSIYTLSKWTKGVKRSII